MNWRDGRSGATASSSELTSATTTDSADLPVARIPDHRDESPWWPGLDRFDAHGMITRVHRTIRRSE
jgi:hypothetical protein